MIQMILTWLGVLFVVAVLLCLGVVSYARLVSRKDGDLFKLAPDTRPPHLPRDN